MTLISPRFKSNKRHQSFENLHGVPFRSTEILFTRPPLPFYIFSIVCVVLSSLGFKGPCLFLSYSCLIGPQ